MSKIQDALKKMQGAAPPPPVEPIKTLRNGFTNGAEVSPIPVARKKKVTIDGEKHHVDVDQLLKVGLLAPMDHAVPIADEFRRIKRPLITNATKGLGELDQRMNVIMIASALPRAGKTFCSVNLAVSLSLERELNVLLVDADVGKPHISREFGLGDAPGLIDLLVDDTRSIEQTLIRTDLNDIQVLPAGRGHEQATELLASERMSRIIEELSTRYPDRIILLDSPPLLITSEAQALAAQVGQIALVVEAGETTQQSLMQTIEVLDSDKAINVILNKSRHSSQIGYYGGDYGYYGYE
ncbi:MAG: XrtA-associated tyrosine autokinase [Woeseia sp.]